MNRTDLQKIPSPVIFRGDDRTAYRDPTAIYEGGWFHLFFTLVETEPDGQVYMYLGKSKSRDLIHWEPVRKLTPRDQSLNYSSPGNIIRFGGKWVICLQTYPRNNGEKYGNETSRVYAAESEDLEAFSTPRMLMVKGDVPVPEMGRMIDPYLLEDAAVPGRWWCFFKQNGVGMSYSADLVHWTFAGHAHSGENVCVIRTDGRYCLFHSPHNGIGVMESDDCVHWTDTGRLITLGQENWSWARGRLTAGFVMDASDAFEGEKTWLMFFHGSGPDDERTAFDQFASVALAWSNDLAIWEWPKGDTDR